MDRKLFTPALLIMILLSGCMQKAPELTTDISTEATSMLGYMVSTNEQTSTMSADTDQCGPKKGDTIVSGEYTLQVESEQGKKEILELGQLDFGGDIDKKVDSIVVGDKRFFVYYQAVDCTTIRAYFVLYDQERGLQKVNIYYPSIDQTDDSLLTINKIEQTNIEDEGLNVTTFPNGLGRLYDSYYVLNENNEWENKAIVEYENSEFDLITSDLQATTGEYARIKNEDFYPIQPKFVDQEILKNIDNLEGYEGVQNIEFENGVGVDIYEFTEASSFEYIINVTVDGEQAYLFTNIISYTISEDGRYLYLDNYVYDESLDIYQEHWRIIDLPNKVKNELAYHYCMHRNGGNSFAENRFISYGQASENESYGKVETEICIVDLDTFTIEKHLTQTSRMACSVACSVDQVGLLPNEVSTLYINRSDLNYFENFEASDITHTVLSLYDIGTLNDDSRDQKHIHVWDDSLANIDYDKVGLDSKVSASLFQGNSDE